MTTTKIVRTKKKYTGLFNTVMNILNMLSYLVIKGLLVSPYDVLVYTQFLKEVLRPLH